MKRKILALAIATLTLFLVGCQPTGTPPIEGQFNLKAIVKSTDTTGSLEVEVVESDYAFGVYIVHTSKATFIDSDGQTIEASDIKVGDSIEINYGGQVMMSYPPQIVAYKIKKI